MLKLIAPALMFSLAGVAGAATTESSLSVAAASNAQGMLIGEKPALAAAPSGRLWSDKWLAMCFAPGTDEVYMQEVYNWILTESGYDPNERYFADASWNSGANAVGTPTARTYSFPSDTLGGIGGGSTTQNVLNSRFVTWFGSVAEGQDKVRQMFNRWQALAAVSYTLVNDDNASWGSSGGANRGDIRIVSINIDGPGGTLAFNFFPTNGDMVVDSADNFGSSGNNFRFFRNVVAHENGHGMGLAHSCPQNSTKLMEPAANTNFDGPQHDDIRGMQRIYGDNFEPNETVAQATNVGQVGASLVVTDRSIDNGVGNFFPSDTDFVKFLLPTAGTLDIRVMPVGFTYNNAPQGGGCPTGTPINSLTVHNLDFELRDTNGTTVLATADSAAAGQTESIEDFVFETGGTYYLRVFTTSSTSDIQLYRLEMNFVGVGCPGDANGDNVVDFSDLNIVLFQFNQVGPSLIGDLNEDGIVDFGDLNLVLSNYNQAC